jgi:hypothetical protein
VANAVSAGGPEYAPVETRGAQDKLDRANQAMAANDYSSARMFAEQAEADAQLAGTKARAVKAKKAADTTAEQNRVLQEELSRKSK